MRRSEVSTAPLDDAGSPAGPLGPFAYEGGRLTHEGSPISGIAERFGTPVYLYSAAGIRRSAGAFREAFARFTPEIHFAAKACGNVRILSLLVGAGLGIDAVSGGEVERAWLAGCPMHRIAFAGVGKSEAEIAAAIDGGYSPLRGTDLPDRFGLPDPVDRGPVGLINVESEAELARVDRIARDLSVRVRVALRVNPDIDARTHPYTTTGRKHNKFGIDLGEAEKLYRRAARAADGTGGADPIGLHVHIGSPVYEPEPFAEAALAIARSASRLREVGCRVEVLDMGGGWPSAYRPEQARDLDAFANAIGEPLAPEIERGTEIHFEPGRSIIATNGLLLTSVEYVKATAERRFIICDAGMQTLLRPSLYESFHAIWPVDSGCGPFDGSSDCESPPADIVGPICETGDFIARDRPFPRVAAGELLAVFGAGAYGMSMASTYNQHPRPAEVLLDGDRAVLIRPRESIADLIGPETVVADA